MKEENIDFYLKKYCDRFEDSFPYFLVRGMSEEEIIKKIKKSLETNKPFKPEIKEGCYY